MFLCINVTSGAPIRKYTIGVEGVGEGAVLDVVGQVRHTQRTAWRWIAQQPGAKITGFVVCMCQS